MNRFASTLLVLAALSFVWNTPTALAESAGDQGAAPAATGPETSTGMADNPPLSGFDEPSFEPGYGARSYLLPSVQVSQAVDTNATGTPGSDTTIRNVTRALGSLTLQEMWKNHPLDLVYSGGIARYYGHGASTYQIHSLAGTQRFLWRTGQFALRDSFSYLPQGSFGFGSFGGAGAASSGATVPGGSAPGIVDFGSVGNQPRISNDANADITQYFTARTSVIVSGGFGVTDFVNAPKGYINSQQTSAQAGYNYQLSRHDQVAFTYAYQELHFPQSGSGSFNVNVWQLMYGHRISGKLDLKLSLGPQWIRTSGLALTNTGALVPSHRNILTGSGLASLMYHMSPRSNLLMTYSHSTTAGSGFFAGANTDAVRFAFSHTLTRHWSSTFDTGYSRNSRILPTPASLTNSAIFTNNASTYQYWYAGAGLRRQLGRHFGAFASYQYDDIRFNSGFCAIGNSCNTYGRNVGLLGLDWTPHPIRLD